MLCKSTTLACVSGYPDDPWVGLGIPLSYTDLVDFLEQVCPKLCGSFQKALLARHCPPDIVVQTSVGLVPESRRAADIAQRQQDGPSVPQTPPVSRMRCSARGSSQGYSPEGRRISDS